MGCDLWVHSHFLCLVLQQRNWRELAGLGAWSLIPQDSHFQSLLHSTRLLTNSPSLSPSLLHYYTPFPFFLTQGPEDAYLLCRALPTIKLLCPAKPSPAWSVVCDQPHGLLLGPMLMGTPFQLSLKQDKSLATQWLHKPFLAHSERCVQMGPQTVSLLYNQDRQQGDAWPSRDQQ